MRSIPIFLNWLQLRYPGRDHCSHKGLVVGAPRLGLYLGGLSLSSGNWIAGVYEQGHDGSRDGLASCRSGPARAAWRSKENPLRALASNRIEAQSELNRIEWGYHEKGKEARQIQDFIETTS